MANRGSLRLTAALVSSLLAGAAHSAGMGPMTMGPMVWGRCRRSTPAKPTSPARRCSRDWATTSHRISTEQPADPDVLRPGRQPAVRLQPRRGDPLVPRGRPARSGLRDVLVGRRLRARPQHQPADAGRRRGAGLGGAAEGAGAGAQGQPGGARLDRGPGGALLGRPEGRPPRRWTRPSPRRWARCGAPIRTTSTPASFYAEAMMDTQPWDYWQPDGVTPEGPRGRRSSRPSKAIIKREPEPSGRAAPLHPRRGGHDHAGARRGGGGPAAER